MSSPTPTPGGNGQPPPQPNQQPPPLSEQGYTVVAGDTLSSIAQALGISLSELEAINNQIPNKDDIQVGQVINVPSNSPSNSPQNTFVYTVVAGDTLSDIAQAFGTSLSALEALNHQIQNPNLIFPGQLITVPLSSQQNIFVYTIAAGDTLSDIALQFGTSLSALEALNHQIKYPDLIFPGQVIAVPT
jgi:tyrosinase